MSKSDGGPAFPGPVEGLSVEQGMTMRQWYKGRAMSKVQDLFYNNGVPDAKKIANTTGLLADAMIKEDEAHEQALNMSEGR